MSQFNRLNVPTLSTDQLLVNGFYFNTQYRGDIVANGGNVFTTPLTTEVIINDQTKNQALFANIVTLEGEVGGNISGNIAQLQNELDAVEANVAILQGNVVTLQNEINLVEGNVTILQGNVVSLQGQINLLTGNVVIDEAAIAELIRDTQFLEAPHPGLAGNTSLFWRGLQVYNTPTDVVNETTGTGIFSYLDGNVATGSQIQLRVEDSRNVLVKGSTTINTPANGLVKIGGTGNVAMTFNVGNSTNNAEIAMNGNINLKGDSTSRVSVYTKSQLLPIPSTTKTAEIVGADEANVLGKKVTATSDDGGTLVLTGGATMSGSSVNITSSGQAQIYGGGGAGRFYGDTGGANMYASNGKGIDIQCTSGNSNSIINIGTQQGTTDTGYTTVNIGNASSATLRTSSTFLDGDTYLPKVPVNPAGYDNLAYIGLPTPFSGPLHGPIKSTFNPYIRSISTFCPEATVNSFVQASGAFTVNVGLGGISLMTGTGGMAITCAAGLMAIQALIGGVGITTAGGAIALTSGAGIIQMTTGAAPIAMETNVGDILLKAGYSNQSTPELSLGSVYIQARDFSYITPDKGVIVGEGIVTPFNENLLNTMGYPFTGNLFANTLVGNLTGVFSNTFQTPNSTTTLLNPVNSNLIYSNLFLETGTAFALLRNMDINGTIATSSAATVPSGNLGANVAITNTTTNFYFPDNTILPLNANVKLFVYVNDTPNIANYKYSTWQANAQIQSNISGLVNAYVEPLPPSYENYMTVLGNVGILSDLDVGANITVASSSFPAQQTLITRNSVTTTGNVTCNTLNYTTLNPPIVLPNIAPGVDSIIAGTNVSISPLNGIGNVVINCTLPNIAGVNSIIAGNGIQVSPVGGQGNVTVSLAGSVIPPGGYLPIAGGTMTGPIYQFPSSNINDNTVKKYRPLTSYQPPFPSIGPPTFTGEQLCFFNGDNSPEQTGFTGWFPQNLITAQPSAMTSPIAISALQKFYQFVGGNSGSSQYVTAIIPNFKIGDHIKGGYFPYSALDEGLIGGANIAFYNTLNFKTVLLHQQFLQMPFPSPNSTTFPELDYIYQGGEQGDGSVNTAVFAASVDAQGEPFVTCNRNPGNGDWEGYLNFAVNETTQFMAVTVDSAQAVIYEYIGSTQQVNKLITVGLTSGTYAAGEEAVGGIFTNPQRYADTKLIYFYGRFDTAILAGVTTVVNNIFAYNVDTNTIVTLKTLTSDPLYSATVPVGTNGRVNGVWVSQLIVAPTVRNMVYFWGDFTGPNQMGIATPPTGINWVNNGFAISDNDVWTSSQIFRPVPQQYLNCGVGCVNIDTAAVQPLNTQMFVFVGSFNGVTKNTVMSLAFDGGTLTAFSTDFCFSNGGVGTSATNKVKNIIILGDRIYFLGNWTGTASNGTSDVPVYSLAATLGAGTFNINTGIFSNPFIEICGSSNTGFWLEDGVPIETTVIQTTDVNANPVNLLIGTQGYKVGNNGGGVLLFPDDQINDQSFLPTKEPVLGSTPYEVRLIPSINPPTAVQMTTSLDINNFWWSQTFNSTNPLIPPTAPTVNAINGAFFAVGNFEMDKIVFSGQDTDYNSVSFIAGDVEAGDKKWYWQAQVGAIDYYAGATFYPNVTALGTTAVPTSDTLGAVMINGNIASTSLNMNNFDILNGNTIFSSNILTLLPVNAVEIGTPQRRSASVYTPIINNVAECDQWASFPPGVPTYKDSIQFDNPTAVALFDRLSVTAALSYDDGLGNSALVECKIYTNIGGVETLIATSQGASVPNIDRNTFPPQMTSFVFTNDIVIPIITTPDYWFFRFEINTAFSYNYAYYGDLSVSPGTLVQTAAVYLPTTVFDPIDYFNVYGTSFFSGNVLNYGNVICENPNFPNVVSTLNNQRIFFDDVIDAYQSYMTAQNLRMINSYYYTDINGYGVTAQNTIQGYTTQMVSTGITASQAGGFSSTLAGQYVTVNSTLGGTIYNHQINNSGFESITTTYNVTPAQTIAELTTNGTTALLVLRQIVTPATPVSHLFQINNPYSGDCTISLSSTSSPRNLAMTAQGQISITSGTASLTGQTTIGAFNNASIAVNQRIFAQTQQVDDFTNPTFQIWNNNASTASFPSIKFNKTTTATPAGSIVGAINFYARDAGNTSYEWARMTASARNVGAGNQDGSLSVSCLQNGAISDFFSFNGADNENNSLKPLDMNGQSIKTSSGSLTLSATSSVAPGGHITLAPLSATGDLIFEGTNIQSATSGGSAGTHLRIKLNGVYYKIALQQDT